MNSLVIFAILALAGVSALPTESASVAVSNTTSIDPLLKAALDKLTQVVPKEKLAAFGQQAYRASRDLDLNKLVSKINLEKFPLSLLANFPLRTIGTVLPVVALVAIIVIALAVAFGVLPIGLLASKWHKLTGRESEDEEEDSYANYQPVQQQYPVRYSRAFNSMLGVASDVYTAWEKYDALNKTKTE